MNASTRKVAAATALFALMAIPVSLHAARDSSTPDSSHVKLGDATLGPFAYTHFCMRYAAECKPATGSKDHPHEVSLTAQRLAQLVQVNEAVNRKIAPKAKVGDVSFDTWRINPASGDCNDYAVSKRHDLIADGWPSDALLLSEVVAPDGEHHLVLLVRTAQRDVVLDNLSPAVKLWRQTPYRWVRVQTPADPVLWSTVKASGQV
jgi:predicted transglutaminase-like cysteine proteinase